MESPIIQIIISIIPILVSIVGTFIITYYQCNKNIPLDKLEISYNRVYYPIYKIIFNSDEKNINQIIIKIKPYILKGDKYVDGATKKLFKLLQENQNNPKRQKKQYKIFEENIIHYNEYLRKRLGYLVPKIDILYALLPFNMKLNFYIWVEMCFLVPVVQFSALFDKTSKEYHNICILFLGLIIAIFVEIVILVINKVFFSSKNKVK